MAQMFDKISADFLNAIKGVLEAKAHTVPTTDKEKKLAALAEPKDKITHADVLKGRGVTREESDMPFKPPFKTAAERKDDYGNKVKNVAKHLAKKAMNAQKNEETLDEMSSKMKMKLGLYGKKKKMKEEVETIDELSVKKLDQYRTRARQDIIDTDETDEKRIDKRAGGYLAASRKIQKKLAKEEVEQVDEISGDMKSRYKKAASQSMDQAQDFKSELDNEGEPKGSRVRKDVNRIIKNRKMGMKRANEEAQQVDEKLSDEAKAAIRFAAGGGAKVKPLVKIAKMTKKPMDEEVEQVDKLTKEEIEMIEAKMAGVAPGSMDCDKHMCATKVFHKEWNEGTPIKTMHADPDTDGLIEWYDVMFDHGIERVMTEDMEVLQAESHMHSKKKMKEESEELDELSMNTLDSYRSKARNEIIAARNKDTDTTEKRLKGYTKASQNIQKNFVKGKGMKEDTLDEARGRPKKADAKDFTVHPRTKEKLMHDNPAHMKRIELLQKNKVLEKPKTEANQHVINQLQKAKTSMTGGTTINFTHGESKHVSGTHAAKIIAKYQGMAPAEKEAFQKKISHSHAQLMKHV